MHKINTVIIFFRGNGRERDKKVLICMLGPDMFIKYFTR